MQQNGYTNLYLNNQDFRQCVNQLATLAFVNLEDVVPTFEQLLIAFESFPDIQDQLLDMSQYFERNYIRINGRDAFYTPSLWNQRCNMMADAPRTNNRVEGWHRHFIGYATTCHPTTVFYKSLHTK